MTRAVHVHVHVNDYVNDYVHVNVDVDVDVDVIGFFSFGCGYWEKRFCSLGRTARTSLPAFSMLSALTLSMVSVSAW